MAPRIIKDTSDDADIDANRIRLYGLKIEDECPSCGDIWLFYGDDPDQEIKISNGKATFYAHCSCGNNWNFDVNLGVKISL